MGEVRPPPEGAEPDEVLDPRLLDAIEGARRWAGGQSASTSGRPVLRYDPVRPRRLRARVGVGVLVALLLTAVGAMLLPPARQAPREVEADLRWAVAQVVGEVEAVRRRTGRLPTTEELHGLVSELVVYRADGDAYTVTAQRDGVRVLYDGTEPLEAWLQGV